MLLLSHRLTVDKGEELEEEGKYAKWDAVHGEHEDVLDSEVALHVECRSSTAQRRLCVLSPLFAAALFILLNMINEYFIVEYRRSSFSYTTFTDET